MKLIGTFEILEGVLYSAMYDAPEYENVNEFRRLLSQWNDREYPDIDQDLLDKLGG